MAAETEKKQNQFWVKEKKSENKIEVGNTEDVRTLSYFMWPEYMVNL